MLRALTAALCLLTAAHVAATDLRFHFPEGGLPPFLFLPPGGGEPTGLVADLLAEATRGSGVNVRYDFRPSVGAAASLQDGSADGALFFSVSRPPPAGARSSEPLVPTRVLLVTPRTRPLAFQRLGDLKGRMLCTLDQDRYPPLRLLGPGAVLERKGKTEQAVLMMLRDDRCSAATVNEHVLAWMTRRYAWDDLATESEPLVRESVLLGFAGSAGTQATAVGAGIRRLQADGGLRRLLQRWGL